MKKKSCKWIENEIGSWHSDCGNVVQTDDDERPYDLGYRYCMYCGRPIEEYGFNDEKPEDS